MIAEHSKPIAGLAFGMFVVGAFGWASIEGRVRERSGLVSLFGLEQEVTPLDTVRYDDGSLSRLNIFVRPGDRFGVWMTPIRTPGCSLVAIEYEFESFVLDTALVAGFVNSVPTYTEGGPPLIVSGDSLADFTMVVPSSGGIVTAVLDDPIAAPDSADLLIGWSQSFVDTTTIPGIAGDSLGGFDPERSYLIRSPIGAAGPDSLLPLNSDLGVRGLFSCRPTLPDSGEVSAQLRWNKDDVDLDLYLVLPASSDTVYWNRRTTPSGGALDVDDNDGFGPERITHPFNRIVATDSVGHLGVYYAGPPTGVATQASVIVTASGWEAVAVGPCRLRPNEWWTVGVLSLATGEVTADTACSVTVDTLLAGARKG